MIPFIFYMVLVCSVIDISLTNLVLRKVKRYNIRGINNREWYQWELNPIARHFYKHFGLNGGLLMSFAYSLGLIIVISILFTDEILWFALGALAIVIIIHLDNLRSINRAVKKGNIMLKETPEYKEFNQVLDKEEKIWN